MTTSDDWHSI